MRRWFWLLVLVGMLTAPRPGHACTPPEGDWWFTEHFEFDTADLPAGINIHLIPKDKLHNPSRQEIEIINDSATPLAILKPTPGRGRQQLDLTQPENWVVMTHVKPNQSHFFTAISLMSPTPNFDDLNLEEYDYPDENIQLPPQQESYLLLKQNEQTYRIPFSVSYTHNEAFEPTKVSGGSCGLSLGAEMFILLVGGILNLFQQPYCLIGLIIPIVLVILAKIAKRYVT